MRKGMQFLSMILSICLLVSICGTAYAEGGIIVDEDASKELVLYGDAAKKDDGTVELTPLATWKSGSAWYSRQIDAASGFITSFDYWAGGGRGDSYNGADGIVLTLAKETGLGSDGEYLGFVPGSYGVELDSYPQNPGDPNGKHIAIIYNQVSNHLTYKLDDRVDDSQWHTVRITYESNTLTVFLDDEQVLSHDGIELPDEVYLGISAATGAGKNQHLIRNFLIQGIVSSGTEFGKDSDPIIIVPGVMGSRLFTSSTTFNDSTRVWDPVLSENLVSWNTVSSLLKLNDSVSGDLYPRPCENQQDYEAGAGTAQKYGREYGAKNTYKKTVDTLCSEFPDRPVYVFSYDWRKSNSESAQLLAEQIDLISQEYDSKVDLVCHSMGGLVASSYFAQYGSEKIDKIITCGTPYEGAPKLLNSVLTKQVLDDGVSDFALWSLGGLSTETKASFDGVAQLTPTYQYTDKFPMYKDHWAPLGWFDYKISYQDYAKICADIFGDTRFVNAMEFQKSIRTNSNDSGYNVLYDYENAYFVIGKNHPTISAIKFQLTTNGVDETFTESDLSYTIQGDGTVPFYSASIEERLSDSQRCRTADVNHTQTITDAKCLEWIADILSKGASLVESDPDEDRSFIIIRVACPVDVSVSLGDEALVYDSNDQTVCTDASFGRMDLIGESGEIKMFCVDASSDYDVLLQGTAEGTMDYAIRYFDAQENLVDERIFEDVPLTDQTVITTGSDSSGDIQLEVDENGDGTTDEIWSAGSGEWITVPDNERIPMTGLSLDSTSATICVGESTVVKAQAHPVNTTDLFFVSYTSSNEAVAAVSDNGEVVGMAPGYAWITAATSNGYTVQFPVTVRFTDVREGKFYYKPVMWAVDAGITKGTTNAEFSPDGTCTRGQVVTFLWRAAGSPEPETTSHPFTDVKEGAFYYKAMLWAVENGITSGMTDTTFAPGDPCTRGQVVTFLHRAAGSPAPVSTEHPFLDAVAGKYYYKAMLWAVENDITSGINSTTFAPGDPCTRGQVVTFLYRAYAE